ncbi:MAG: hypothetical protein LBS00_12610, partial [Synergistaceae bacterium]|jgi:hypothetical protein|nr:hypothetical protein [Synergistaceae bacterium]
VNGGSAVLQRDYVTDERGEFEIALDGAPEKVIVFIKAGNNDEQPFTLHRAYKIKQLNPQLVSNLHPFRVLNGFDEIAAGLTVQVRTADDEKCLAVDGGSAVLQRDYVTDERGEFEIALDGAQGNVDVLIKVGNQDERRFTLNGDGAPHSGLFLRLTGGDAFVAGGAQGYQSIVTMTITRNENGMELPITDEVTWTLESSTVNLPLSSIWNRDAGAKNGLMWVTSDTASVDGTTTWDEDKIEGTAPTGSTVYLADVVGSRTIKVKATLASSETVTSEDFTFGAGPLSEFGTLSAGSSIMWASKYQSGNQTSNGDYPSIFEGDDNSFPAATICNGSVKNKVTTTPGNVGATATDAGFTPQEGGWDNPKKPSPDSTYAGRYANTSNMATAEQLLAVSKYDSSHNASGKAAGRKGAALAADWILDAAWTGEVFFGGYEFNAFSVNVGSGEVDWWFVGNNSSTPGVVCRKVG